MAAYRCVVCDVSFDKLNHFKRHQETKKHKIAHSFSKLSEETYEEQISVLCPEDAKSSELFFSEEENSDVQDDDVEEVYIVTYVFEIKEILYLIIHVIY